MTTWDQKRKSASGATNGGFLPEVPISPDWRVAVATAILLKSNSPTISAEARRWLTARGFGWIIADGRDV